MFTTANIGIKVVAVETGEVIYERNPLKLHHPASTTKLFAAATCFGKNLGSDYQFETTLYVDGDADTQVIGGHLYLKGRADPVLQPQDIVKLVDTLLETGVETIQGDIVVDTTYLDTVRERSRMDVGRPTTSDQCSLSIRQIEPEPGYKEQSPRVRANLLKNELMEKGIEVIGDVVPGTVPLDARAGMPSTYRHHLLILSN